MSKTKKSNVPSQADLRRQLAALNAQRSSLLRALHGSSGTIAPHVPLWTVLSEYLQAHGGTATVAEMVEAMIQAGHNLGKYPKRTVKAALVSPSLRSVFAVVEVMQKGVRVETVKLRATVGQIHYARGPHVQHTGKDTAATPH